MINQNAHKYPRETVLGAVAEHAFQRISRAADLVASSFNSDGVLCEDRRSRVRENFRWMRQDLAILKTAIDLKDGVGPISGAQGAAIGGLSINAHLGWDLFRQVLGVRIARHLVIDMGVETLGDLVANLEILRDDEFMFVRSRSGQPTRFENVEKFLKALGLL